MHIVYENVTEIKELITKRGFPREQSDLWVHIVCSRVSTFTKFG